MTLTRLSLPCILICMFFLTDATSQVRQERHETTQREVQLEQIASREIQNLFPENKEGIIYRRGREIERTMNYNVLLELFYVVENNRENWLMPWDSDSVLVEGRKFHFFEDHGYFEVVAREDGVMLLEKHTIDVASETVTRGAYGTTTRSSSAQSVRSVHDTDEYDSVKSSAVIENPGGEELHISLRREEAYYMLKNGEPADISSRRAIRQEFSDHRRDARRYVRRNDLKYDNKKDMLELAKFIQSLIQEDQ